MTKRMGERDRTGGEKGEKERVENKSRVGEEKKGGNEGDS